MSQLENAVEILKFATEVVDKKGPIMFSSNIKGHSKYMHKVYTEDLYTLASDGKIVTLGEVYKMVLSMHEELKKYEDGRSYFFEEIVVRETSIGTSEKVSLHMIVWTS